MTKAALRHSAFLLLLTGAVSGGCSFRPHHPPPSVHPVPSRNPPQTSTVDPNDPMLRVNWVTATLKVDAADLGCWGWDVLTFHAHKQGAAVGTPGSDRYVQFSPAAIVYGDLTGDGLAEAVLLVQCGIRLAWPHALTWLVRRDGSGDLHIFANPNLGGYVWIDNGALYGQPAGHGDGYWLGRVSAVRWNGTALVPVDTSARYPALTSLDLSAVAAKLPCHGLAPRTQLRLAFDPQLRAVDGDRLWQLDREQWGGIWDDLGRTGQPYVLTDIACAPSSAPEFDNAQDRIILLDLTPAGWRVLAVIDTGPIGLWEWHGNTGPTVTLRQIEVTGEDHNVDYVWNGTEFVRH